ncbi:hypothetical protein D9M70_247980 [compost metagenome]
MDEVLGGADGQVVHHFQATGDDAGGNDVADGAPGFFHGIERRQQHFGGLRLGQQLDRDFGDHPEQAFGAGEQRQQVETGGVEGVGAQAQVLAINGEDVDLEHVVHGQAVLQAVHATGIFRDVAADGTGDLRGRIRRVIQAEGCRCLGNRQIAYAGLNPCGTGGWIDVQDVVEARHHQQHAFLQGQRAAGQPGPRATGHDGDAQFMADPQHPLDFVDGSGQHHQHRRGAIGRQPVAFVGLGFLALMQDLKSWHAGLQGVQQRLFVDVGQGAVNAFIVENVHRRSTLVLLMREVCFRGPLS